MKEFKIRCSAIGDIMAGEIGLTETQEAKLQTLLNKATPLTALQAIEVEQLQNKKANPELPKGVQTYCLNWIKEQLYERRKEISSKYTQKGNDVEDESIWFIGRWLGFDEFQLNTGQFVKNQTYFENDFMTGTPDVLPLNSKLVVDAKNSWDFMTFPFLDKVLPEDKYWWQGQGYMKLTDRTDYKVAYTLMNTPEGIIESEMRRYAYANGLEPDNMDYSEWYDKMSYDNTPEILRIKIFDFKRDDEAIKRIEERVILCRKFINSVLAQLPQEIKDIFEINF